MKNSPTSESYKKTLETSFDLTQNTIDKLKEFSNNSEKVDTNELNEIQRNLIFDTVKLVQSKNIFKNEIYKINEDNINKVKHGDSSVLNSFLLKWEVQTFKNNQQWNLLNESLKKLPDLKINDIIDNDTTDNIQENDNEDIEMKDMDEYNDFIKSLNIPLDQINKLLWSDKEFEDIESVRNKYLIPEQNNEKLKQILDNSDIKKFRLVQLHDKYYERKIIMLKELDRKWNFEINKIKQFVSSDVNKMKNELSNKLESMKQEEENSKESELERERLELNRAEDVDEDAEIIAYQGERDDDDHEEEEDNDEREIEGENDAVTEDGEDEEIVEEGDGTDMEVDASEQVVPDNEANVVAPEELDDAEIEE